MEKRIKDMVDMMSGKAPKKKKKWVDDKEFEKLTGKPAMTDDGDEDNMDDDTDADNENPDKKKRHGLFGRASGGKGLHVIIQVGRKGK